MNALSASWIYVVDPLLAVDCTLAKADGWCDPDCNGHARDWDGGDCCETTCLTGLAKAYACGSHGAYECLDPTAGDGAGSFDFVGTTVPTNSTYVPYWWEDLGPSIALSFFVAAVASTLLMLGVYVLHSLSSRWQFNQRSNLLWR